ncbi:MAG: VanZ family protein [Clostridia bacterium]|nr:VanZ family protein [Clostridia bacterium]
MKKRKIYVFLFVFILCFIFGNSMLSKELSGTISKFVAGILGGEAGSTDEGHHLVRKLAHFTEYAALGAVGHLLFDSMMQDKYRKYVTVSLVGVTTPLVDETIQIFSMRGPALTDVWIDVGGYLVGVLLVFALCALRQGCFERHRCKQ